jgi:signal transduction histidine kinase
MNSNPIPQMQIPSNRAKPLPGQPLVQETARDVTELRRLERKIVEISDREKDRLGRDLHDGLCQNLAGIAALGNTLSRRLATHKEAANAAEISKLLEEAIVEARNLARCLNPVELNGCGLIPALEAFAVNVQARFRISCVFRCDLAAIDLSSSIETHLYRIVQETVSNAINHGRAEWVAVSLSFTETIGKLTVRDNGIGIPADPCYGNGIHSMTYRARLIGASLCLRPDSRKGTRMDCVFGFPPSSSERASHD